MADKEQPDVPKLSRKYIDAFDAVLDAAGDELEAQYRDAPSKYTRAFLDEVDADAVAALREHLGDDHPGSPYDEYLKVAIHLAAPAHPLADEDEAMQPPDAEEIVSYVCETIAAMMDFVAEAVEQTMGAEQALGMIDCDGFIELARTTAFRELDEMAEENGVVIPPDMRACVAVAISMEQGMLLMKIGAPDIDS